MRVLWILGLVLKAWTASAAPIKQSVPDIIIPQISEELLLTCTSCEDVIHIPYPETRTSCVDSCLDVIRELFPSVPDPHAVAEMCLPPIEALLQILNTDDFLESCKGTLLRALRATEGVSSAGPTDGFITSTRPDGPTKVKPRDPPEISAEIQQYPSEPMDGAAGQYVGLEGDELEEIQEAPLFVEVQEYDGPQLSYIAEGFRQTDDPAITQSTSIYPVADQSYTTERLSTPLTPEQATTEQTTTEQTTTEQTTTKQTTTEQAKRESASTEQSTTLISARDQPVTQPPITEQPITRPPTTEQATTDSPSTDQPTTPPPSAEERSIAQFTKTEQTTTRLPIDHEQPTSGHLNLEQPRTHDPTGSHFTSQTLTIKPPGGTPLYSEDLTTGDDSNARMRINMAQQPIYKHLLPDEVSGDRGLTTDAVPSTVNTPLMKDITNTDRGAEPITTTSVTTSPDFNTDLRQGVMQDRNQTITPTWVVVFVVSSALAFASAIVIYSIWKNREIDDANMAGQFNWAIGRSVVYTVPVHNITPYWNDAYVYHNDDDHITGHSKDRGGSVTTVPVHNITAQAYRNDAYAYHITDI